MNIWYKWPLGAFFSPVVYSYLVGIFYSADVVVIPTGEGLDDLEPSVILANNLFKEGVLAKKIVFALSITSDSQREVASARILLLATG